MKTLIRALAALVTRAPGLVLVGTLAVTAVLAALSTTTETATGQEGFAPESEEILASERIGELFGESAQRSVLQVVVASDEGDVLTRAALEAVEAGQRGIEASDAGTYVVDGPDGPGVISYLTPVQAALAQQATDPSDLDDDAVRALHTQALADAGPELAFAGELMGTASDGSELGLMLVFIDSTTDINDQIEREVAVADALRAVDVDGVRLQPFSFALLFGEDDEVFEEIGRLFATAFAIIIGVLLFVYWLKPVGATRRSTAVRRMLADTGVTMLTIVFVVLWMNGIGALLQRAGVLGGLTEVAQIVPILLVGLGVDYGIHLNSRYRDEVGIGRDVDTAMRTAIGTVGIALVLATLTTAIGFLTNVVNPVPALGDFGILASVGIVAAFALMLTFVPALRVLLDRRAEAAGRLPAEGMGATRERLLPNIVARSSVLAERAPVPTLVVALGLGALGYVGLSNLSTEFSFTDFLPEDAEVVQTLRQIEDGFGGGFAESTDVLVESDALADPEVFNAVVAATEAVADIPGVLTVSTPAGELASLNAPGRALQQLSALGPDGTPVDPELAAALVDAGFDAATGRIAEDADLAAIVDVVDERAPGVLDVVLALQADGSGAALIDVDTQAGEGGALELRDALVAEFEAVQATGAEVAVTSANIITGGIVESLSSSQVTSLVITLLAAVLVLMITFWIENRRPMLGVLTMLPVALVVLWTFGLMYASGIPFGPVTATLTGLAVGIGVPYTIHMTRRFEEDRNRYADVGEAIRETTRNTGGALAGSAATTALGFGVLITSSLVPFQQMGQVTAYAIVLSLVGAILVLPSLLVLWERWHRRRGDPVVERETVSVA